MNSRIYKNKSKILGLYKLKIVSKQILLIVAYVVEYSLILIHIFNLTIKKIGYIIKNNNN